MFIPWITSVKPDGILFREWIENIAYQLLSWYFTTTGSKPMLVDDSTLPDKKSPHDVKYYWYIFIQFLLTKYCNHSKHLGFFYPPPPPFPQVIDYLGWNWHHFTLKFMIPLLSLMKAKCASCIPSYNPDIYVNQYHDFE